MLSIAYCTCILARMASIGFVIMDALIPDSGAAIHCSASLGIQSGACAEIFPAAKIFIW